LTWRGLLTCQTTWQELMPWGLTWMIWCGDDVAWLIILPASVSFSSISLGLLLAAHAWLLKARTTTVRWRWWLPPVGSTDLSVANGGGGADDGTVDGRWRWRGRHWLRRCLCCCKPESMLAVMGVVGSGVWCFVILIWLLKPQVCCGSVEAPLKVVCNAVLGCWRQPCFGGAVGLWRQQVGVALWASCGAEWWWWLDVRSADGGERMKLVGAPPLMKVYFCWCERPFVAAGCWRRVPMDWCGGIGCDRRWRQPDQRFAYCCILRMNSEQCTVVVVFFFLVIRTVVVFFEQWTVNNFFFLDQTRVKHKPVDRLIVRTIKSHALIPNLTRDNKQKN